jgi:hypothetical protein
MRFGWNAEETSVRIRWIAKIAAVIFIAIYITLYLFEPFSDVWNSILGNSLVVIASSFTASVATMIWAHYDKTDTPRRIWAYFAIGLWLWVAGELTWGYQNVTIGEVPEGPADVFWVISYFFLGSALLFQYQILVRPARQELWSRILTGILLLIALNLIIYRVLTSGEETVIVFDVALNSFYPAADLLLALIALWLARNFMGGAFSRPWLGLLAFTFADLLYAWIEASGLYSWSVNEANPLSTITDVAYVGAYLVLGLGVLSQWVFLKYGLRSPAPEQ